MPKERQTLMFSATIPNQILELVGEYMNNPKFITVHKELTVPNIEQFYLRLKGRQSRIVMPFN